MCELDLSYAHLLEALGKKLVWTDEYPWYLYNGFMRPAFLPHVCPEIEHSTAKEALRKSGAMFARWEHPSPRRTESQWWQTNRRGHYSLSELSRNTRSKVKRGNKHFDVRPATPEEIQQQGYEVCQAAVKRYDNRRFLPSADVIASLARAGRQYPESIEAIGVFDRETMVAFSENHIQKRAVLFDNIWLDPKGLSRYSSYALFDYMLDRYLNSYAMDYVSDGVRTLHHESGIHQFLIRKFRFEHEPATLKVVYRSAFTILVNVSYPFRAMVHRLAQIVPLGSFTKASGILEQEAILRSQRADSIQLGKVADD